MNVPLTSVKVTMTTLLILLLSGVLSSVTGAEVQNSCNLNNGYCRYQVRVVSECDPNVQNSPQHGNQYGHDGPNAIEKYLLEVKSEHSKRLVELEKKIESFTTQKPEKITTTEAPRLVETLSNHKLKSSNKLLSRVKKRTRSRNKTGFKKDPLRKENHLLNRVHSEFTSLRNDLADIKNKLSVTEKSLHQTQKELNASKTENRKLSHQLRHTEGKLEEEQANGYRMRKQLEKTDDELNDTKSKLTETQNEVRRMRLENWRIKGENDDCQKELEQCLLEKETLRRALEQALIKYHDLNLKHENITIQLNTSREEVMTCYRGKTTQFCGFEDPQICGFERGEGGSEDLEWIRWHKETPSPYTGPSRDHTCQNDKGYYMYVEATRRAEGEWTSLVSPRYYGYGEQCVEFYYNMNGYHVGTLKAYTMVPGQDAVPMWRAFGNQGDAWTMARIPVPTEEANKGYQVVFHATIGFGNEGDIAIDDFRVFDGACYVIPTKDDVTNSTTNQKDASHQPITSEPKRDKT